MRQFSAAVLIPIGCVALATVAHAQFGRGATDWSTSGFDAQRSAWVRTDPKISKESLSKPGFAMTWKIGVTKDAKSGVLGPAMLMTRYIGYRGFRSFAFVGGSGDSAYTVDTDLSRLEWHDRMPSAAAVPAGCGASSIPNVARPTSTAFPAVPQGRGGGRASGARSAVGQPNEGAASLAIAAAAAANMAAAGRGGRGDAAAGRGPVPGRGGRDPVARRIQNSLFMLSSDGMLHSVWLSSGEKSDEPIQFVKPGSGPHGLIVYDNVAYAATAGTCGGVSGVFAVNLADKAITNWTGKGPVAGAEGPAVGPDGTLYVANSGNASAVTALEAKTLAQKDWYEASGEDLISSPVIFEFKDKALLAVTSKNKKLILLDTKSLGGADHRTPLFTGPVEAVPQTLASWQDAAGNRWLLGNTEGAIHAWKVVDHNGVPSLEKAWVSQEISSPLAPIVVNGVVFAASKGTRSTPAMLYALDSASGKEMWNSGKTISSTIAEGGISAGDSQVVVGAADGTLYAFGFPIEH